MRPSDHSRCFDDLDGAEEAFDRLPAEEKAVLDQTEKNDARRNSARRVLLVEDNIVNQRVALLMLRRLGYRADIAANGREAVGAVMRQRYDLVLMDVQMPEMDGLEASRKINARWRAQDRPRIIAMTANAMQGDRDRCLDDGMDDYLTKPIRVERLVEALRLVPARTGR